ncbi:MAG: sigma-70 family RNA polymerase sigma factor [Actinobacteria bacterium]|nr:sigma-70 family RNA polymerase sigma factor [Actinomycetota bacterium]
MRSAKSTNSTAHPVAWGSFESLLRQAQSGEQWAFSELYESFRPRVAKFLFNATGDYWLTDELSNDTFMRAHRALNTLEQTKESSFLSFLFRIAANLLCDHHRHKHIPTTDMEDDYWGNVPEAGHSQSHLPADELDGQERSQMLRKGMAELPPEQATLISLSHFDELTAEQIAEILDKPSAQAVRAALYRAMQNLRKVLVHQGYFTPATV